MSKRTTILLLVGILSIATFLRLYHITSAPPGLYPDEAMDGTNAQEALRTGDFKVYYPENNGREGLFMNIQAVFLAATNIHEPWILRLPSALFGILTVLGMYFLGRELFSRRIGLLAAFFTATSFWHINFSRISFRAIMAPFFLVWAVYLLLAALRRGWDEANSNTFSNSRELENKGKHTWWWLAVAGGIFFGLGFYSYIAYRTSPLLLLLFVPFFRKTPNFWKVVWTFLITTFIVALPIGIYFLQNPADFLGRTAQVSIFSSPAPLRDLGLNILKTAGMFNVAGDFNWRHNLAGRPELFWPIGILFIIGLIVAVRTGISKPSATKYESNTNIRNEGTESVRTFVKNSYFVEQEHFGSLFALLWLFLAALPVIISNEALPHALRSILLIPPAFLFAAIGAERAYAFLKRYIRVRWLPVMACVFLSLLVFEAYTTYFILWVPNQNTKDAFAADYVDIGHQINTLPASTPKYVVVPTGGVLVNGIPMPSETVMFITNTYDAAEQQAKNVHYVLKGQEAGIPSGARVFNLQ